MALAVCKILSFSVSGRQAQNHTHLLLKLKAFKLSVNSSQKIGDTEFQHQPQFSYTQEAGLFVSADKFCPFRLVDGNNLV